VHDFLATSEQREWLAQQFDELPSEHIVVAPSAWAEERRYLPASVTSLPGPYRFDVVPYLREVLDCLSIDSPIREVVIQKGAQIGATVGVLENAIGYFIDHVRCAPCMLVTADAELAKLRMDSYVIPMLQSSGLDHLITSHDEMSHRKSGKALWISTPIPTPAGFRPIGDIQPGDTVYGADGTPVRVDCVSLVHERECYEVAFANGDVIVASDDHKWLVRTTHGCTDECRIYTTAEMHRSGSQKGIEHSFRVDVPSAVSGTPSDLPIAPYTLGAWLGDGSSRGANIAIGDAGLGVLRRIEQDGYETRQWTTSLGKCAVFGLYVPGCDGKGTDNFYSRLRRLSLIGNKHIPDSYLHASCEQRLDLLCGLMDTDGTCSTNGACQITQKNERLAREIWSLANSLGFKASWRSRSARAQTGAPMTVFVVAFYADVKRPVFTLPYKLERLKASLASRSSVNAIVRIDPVGKRLVKCIGVDHPKHLFVCGRGYIPTHNTDKKLEWKGGGFLIPFGAQSANKLRSISIQMLLRDEIDGWPDIVGKDGDPLKLVGDRTAAYELSRKILDISTPTVKGSSKIEKRFAAGDQRYYFVCCLKCGFPQRLRWRSLEEGGVITGIVWETESGRLVQESVRWCCSNCHAAHTNDDKTRLLSPAHGAEWRPTAISSSPFLRSYHLSALYSPVGMQSWGSCVAKWLDAWDSERNRPRDTRQLQVFYNNVLGDPFEIRGERVRFEAVSGHRRSWYLYCTPDDPTTLPNLIPNTTCMRYCGSPVLFLTATVDVHSDNLKVAVWGWCRDRRVLLLDYFTFEGDTEQMEAPPWKALRSLIEDKSYESDDGHAYALGITLVDSGYRTDLVYRFCAEYESGVFPVKGREVSPRNQRDKEFSEFTTPTGQRAYGITVDFYKDRWSAALKVEWDPSLGIQPVGHFNAPQNATDKQLRELTAETKVARVDARTGERIGWEWRRPSGAANELWDLLVYGNAAVDLVAWHYCRDQLELEQTNWPAFWDAMVADVTGSG